MAGLTVIQRQKSVPVLPIVSKRLPKPRYFYIWTSFLLVIYIHSK